MKHALTLTLVSLLNLLVLATAHAGGEEHFEKGTVYYNIQDWPNALKEYKLAYELDPKPSTLWAIAQTLRLSGDCRAAILTFRAYARTASAAGAAAADEHIARCQASLAEQQHAVEQVVSTPVPAAAPQATPTASQVSAARDDATPRAWYADPLGHVLLGTGVASTVVGAVFLHQGNTTMRDATGADDYGDYEKKSADAQEKELVGVIALSAGLCVTALSVVRFALVKRRASKARVDVAASARAAFFTYRTTF